MAQLIIDLSGRGGLAPKHSGDVFASATPERRYIGGEGQMADGIFNPFKRYGYMSPAINATTTITFTGGTHDAQFGSSIYDEVNDDFYFAERGLQIFKGDTLDDTEIDRVLNLAGATFTDLEIYEVNGARRLFYSYQSAGGGDIGIATLPFSANNNTWLTASASGGSALGATNNHRMIKADNGFMYVLDGNAIHKIDGKTTGGANGTATMNAITFPTNFQLTDGVDHGGYLWCAMLRRTTDITVPDRITNMVSEAGVYVWNRLTSTSTTANYIPIHGIREIKKIYVAPNGEIRIICISATKAVQIRRFNGSTFEIVDEIAVNDASPNFPDGVQVVDSLTYWLGNDKTLYAHGSFLKGEPEGVYKLSGLSSTESLITSGAALFGGTGNNAGFYLAWTDGSTKALKKFFPFASSTVGSVSQIGHIGNVYTLVKFLPILSTVTDIQIYCLPTATGSSTIATLKIYLNQSTTAFKSYSITKTIASKGYIEIPINKPYVNAIQLKIEFSTAETSSDDFQPAFAIVNYEPTNTKK